MPYSLATLVAIDRREELSGTREWTATAALTASGVVHLVAATTIAQSSILQLLALVAALAQFAAVGFMASLALTDQHPSDAVLGLLLAGTVALLAVDLFVPSGLAAAEACLADVLVAAAGAALLTAFWRRRAQNALMALLVLAWLLWLAGVRG